MIIRNALVPIFIILASTSAYGASLFNSVMQGLVDKCPDFISGSAQISFFTDYADYEVGRLRYNGRCYNPSFVDDELAHSRTKTSDPDEAPERPKSPDDNKGQCPGSIIIPTSRVVGENIPLAGIPFELNYMSDRAPGRAASYTLNIPLSDSNTNVTQYVLDASYGGRTIHETFSNTPGQKYTFVWDGKDSSGNPVYGTMPFDYTVTMTYQISMGVTKDIPISYAEIYLGYPQAKFVGLGGWTPTIYHFYDVNSHRLVRGDGTAVNANAKTVSGGNLMVASEDGSEVYIFSSTGQHLYTKFGLTGQNKYTFSYHDTYQLSSIAMPNSQTVTFGSDGSGGITITSAKGLVTDLKFDGDGNLAKVTDPAGGSYSMSYDSSGLLKTFAKPEGQVNTFTYDAEGSLVRDYHSSGTSTTLSETATGLIRTVTMTSREGQTSSYQVANALETVNEFNTQVTDPASRSVRIRSNGDSQSQIWTDYSVVNSFVPDPRFPESAKYQGFWQVIVNGHGASILSNHSATLSDPDDPFSITQLINKSEVNGKTSTSTYDSATSKWTFSSPEARMSYLTVNEFEQPTRIQRGDLVPALLTYNSDGTLSSTSWGSRLTQYGYDTNGYLKSITNPLGQTTAFQRDSFGRVTKTRWPDGKEVLYSYDKNGNVTGITPPSRPSHQFLLNAFEGLRSYLPPALGGRTQTDYAYNFDQQLTRITRADGRTVNFTYSSSSNQGPATITTDSSSYSYLYDSYHDRLSQYNTADMVGLISYVGPLKVFENQNFDGHTVDLKWYYDEEGRVTQSRVEGVAGLSTVSVAYDKDGLVSQNGWMHYSRNDRGQIITAKLDNAEVDYTYDSNFGELGAITYRQNGAIKFSNVYDRDALGRITYDGDPVMGKYILYDSRGRIARSFPKYSIGQDINYKYDDNGNRVQSYIKNVSDFPIATYDDQDRLTEWNSLYHDYVYTYSADGEIATRTDNNDSSVTNYTFDALGNLTQVTLPSTDVISYKYDALNRRAERLFNGAITARYLYDTQIRVVAEFDGSGTLEKRFVYGSQVNSPDYMEYNGHRYLFVKDVRGSIRKVVDSVTGDVEQELTYDDWGQILSDSSAGFQPFGFAGGVTDPDTGFIHFGARDYDSETGRWLSKDPILFDGGDTNLYGYVLNDPIDLTDSEGLQTPHGPDGSFSGCGGSMGTSFCWPVPLKPPPEDNKCPVPNRPPDKPPYGPPLPGRPSIWPPGFTPPYGPKPPVASGPLGN